nr:endo-1,4-beta-xylanase [uncultured bacterium]
MFTEEAEKYLNSLLKEDSELDFKIKYGTEMYRKGFGHFTLRDKDGNDIPGATIKLKQKNHEYKFGCNAFMIDSFPEAEQNQQYEETFASIFNLAVVPFYWSDLEPEPGKPRFGVNSPFIYRRPAPDRVLEFCKKYNITPKGHPLCWHHRLFAPEWVPQNSREVMRFLARRFEQIAERYADQIPIWDVVNEVLTHHPEARKKRLVLPPDYAERCFKLAEKYFPFNQKIYNDDSVWWDYEGDYSPVYMLVKHLIDRGCQVDGLGLQYHMFANMLQDNCIGINRPLSPSCVWRVLDQYAKLGIPLNMSEVSLLSYRSLGDGDEFQALALERLYRLWFSHPATEAIVWWNLVDGTAACAPMGSEEGENRLRAGLVNYDFTDKKACKVLRRLINEEWHTETAIEYRAGGDNRFHGFYGEYEAEITTGNGTFSRTVDLSKHSFNEFVITLE